MLTPDLINRFPKNPEKPILYVVYNQDMIADAAYLINEIWGEDYLAEHVTITSIDVELSQNTREYAIYLDPLMQTYKHSWN